jgi:hypothetical protein
MGGRKSVTFAMNRSICEIPVDNTPQDVDNNLSLLQDSTVVVLPTEGNNVRKYLEVNSTDVQKNELAQGAQ